MQRPPETSSATAQAKLLGLVAKPLGSALPSGHNPSQTRSRDWGQRARARARIPHVGLPRASGSDRLTVCAKVI